MRRKITSVCLVIAMALMTGCGGQFKESVENAIQEKLDEENEENTASEETADSTSDSTAGDSSEEEAPAEEVADNSDSADKNLRDMDVYLEEFTTYENADDGHRLFTGIVDKVILSDEAKEKYPELSKLIDQYNTLHMDVLNDENLETSVIEEDYKNNEYFTEYSSESHLSFRRLDDKVFSVSSSYFGYSGGAHGYYSTSGISYDLETQKEIGLFDVIADKDALIEYIKEEMDELYPGLRENEADVDKNIENYFSNDEYISWNMEPFGIYIYFNPYDIASYAAGQQVIPVLFDKNPELFTGKYGAQEGDWAIAGSNAYVDLDGDKVIDHVYAEDVMDYQDEYSEVNGIKILVNDKPYEFDVYGFRNDKYIVKKDNKFYMYVVSTGENDWKTLIVYSLNGDEVKQIGEQNGGISSPVSYHSYDEISYTNSKGQLFNPDRFYICERLDLISTFDGSKMYKVGEDGLPETQEELYYCDNKYFEFTSKVDLTVDVADEAGNVIEEGREIPSGHKFTPYKTDNKKYAYLKLEDGTIVRITVDASDWPRKIDGKDLDDVFDGIIFAG